MRRTFIRISSLFTNFNKNVIQWLVRSATYFSDNNCLLFHSILPHKACKVQTVHNSNNDKCSCFRQDTELKKMSHLRSGCWTQRIKTHRWINEKCIHIYNILINWMIITMKLNVDCFNMVEYFFSYIHATLCQHAAYLCSFVKMQNNYVDI